MMIYLIRHGETDWNHQRRRQGRRDVPLNDAGREQMLRCGQLLSGLPVDAIVSSPLSRALDSAAIFAECVDFSKDGIVAEEGLIERDFGDVDGMTKAELKAYRARGGNEHQEPLYRVRERMMRTVLTYARKNDKKHIVMISHSAAIKSVFVRLYGKPELQRKPTKNAGVSIIEYRGG
ncbi:MAG: histidine phosphatase family protein, partial [Clostridia bacterium]|nr:histidine phosphatase family protein [Clostridia bacterium]